MEKMEKLSMLSQPGVCDLECVPVGGIDREKEFSDFWVMGVLLLRTRGLPTINLFSYNVVFVRRVVC